MKLSVSVPSEDVAFLDAYAAEHALGSRSAALHHAVRALRVSALPGSYAEAWSDWDADGGDAEAWEATTGDGLA
ncbi:MAG TPA: ribbon-helix-helix domain-containing protein [Baekduia sp.]|uniref:ribbon-helix-helix domain-containing protein n=1 Tax=Baekduia sp. TaxID=2600305 RepID=UPI002D79FE0B|nr:ribbon-helix-helix domain-containing protein [Baekduia sp.]HET6510387.1 ribbon-helix-helix domain-containing protein [Baekduia sp.]